MKAKPEDAFWEGQASHIVVAVTYPILLLIGTFGNVLTYHILQKTTLGDRSAASWFFKCLTGMCLSCLWLGLPRHWLRTVYEYDIRKSHFIVCKMHRFFLYCAMDITAWVIVFISIDRLITVFAPSRSNLVCTARNAKTVFFGLCVFFAAFNIQIFWAYGRLQQKRIIPADPRNIIANSSIPHEYVKWVIVSECYEFTDNPDLVIYNKIVHPYLSFALYVVGPFFLMLTSSVLISRKLAANRALINKCSEPEPQIVKTRARPLLNHEISNTTNTLTTTVTMERPNSIALLTTCNVAGADNGSDMLVPPLTPTRRSPSRKFTPANVKKEQNDEASMEKTTTRLTIAASVEFLITATPAFFFDIIEGWLLQSNYFASGPRGKAQFNLIYTTVRLLLFSNYALHFFLFCFTVGRFRKEFKKVLKVWQGFIMIEQRVPTLFGTDTEMQDHGLIVDDAAYPMTTPPPYLETSNNHNIGRSVTPVIELDCYDGLQTDPVQGSSSCHSNKLLLPSNSVPNMDDSVRGDDQVKQTTKSPKAQHSESDHQIILIDKEEITYYI